MRYYKEIYYFLHDEKYMQHDLFYLLYNIMKKEINKFYTDPEPGETEPYLIRRAKTIIDDYLKALDKPLYDHFIKIGLDCEVVLQRWLKCVFTREFHPIDAGKIWDAILADNYNKKSSTFEYIDYFCVIMFIYIRDQLLEGDQNQCFTRLFKYPPLESILNLFSLLEQKRPYLKKVKTNLQFRNINSKIVNQKLINNSI
jgi:TBC1 domain family protein 5